MAIDAMTLEVTQLLAPMFWGLVVVLVVCAVAILLSAELPRLRFRSLRRLAWRRFARRHEPATALFAAAVALLGWPAR